MKIIHLGLLILVGLVIIMPAASAATGTGTLYVTNASSVEKGRMDTVSIYLDNTFEPKVGTYEILMYFDDKVVKPIDLQPFNATEVNPLYDNNCAFIGGYAAKGYDNGDLLLATVTLESLQDDGSSSELGLKVVLLKTRIVDSKTEVLTASIQNGTFSTADKVKPVIDITTKSPVSSTFTIAGTIHDVGGMGTAQATLKNATHTVPFDLTLGGSAPGYTFSKQVTWPVYETITLTVNANDAAGNYNSTEPVYLEVKDVGFSRPEPADGSHIKVIPEYVRAFMTAINPASVKMYIGSATLVPIDLSPDTSKGYAKNTTLIDNLADDDYWVNVSGTGDGSIGGEWSLNWSFTLDRISPVIQTFTITDSDGDGYIEAGEDLSLAWLVTDSDPNFDRVALVDVATGKELWNSTKRSDTATVKFDVGNRDLAFRAYDKAGNYDSRTFHLYYAYMIWVNSTKMGEISGIDTTYIAMKDITRTEISSITLYGCTVTFPTLDTLTRSVTGVGQVTNDTYVTVDNNANRTLTGGETYQNAWVLDPGKDLDFLVKVPHARNATLMLAEANETYIGELIKGGKGGMDSVNFTELIRKTAYIFIEGGWTKIIVHDDGTISMPDSSETPITNAGNISATLRHAANQVNLNAGYRLNTQGLKAITPASGDYVLAAIAMDGDRVGFLGAMPVMVMESAERATIPSSVVQGGSITVSFNSSCEHLGVALLRDVAYNGTALIDAATLGVASLHLNLTYNDIPATQKLIGNIYVSPSSGKYVVANTNKTTVSTSGLDAGTYRVYMIGQSAGGTIQAYEEGMLQITAGGSICVTSIPAGAAIALDGVDTCVKTNGTLIGVPAGAHTVTVTLAGYAPASKQVTVVSGETATAHFDLVPVPVANFTANRTAGTVPLVVKFTDCSTNATTWVWNFGDGKTSSEQNPTHTYNTIGRYNVTLTATNSAGSDTLTRYRYISARDAPSEPAKNQTDSSLHDSGTTTTTVDGKQQVTFNATAGNGTTSNNDIILTTGTLNVTIQTDGLTEEDGNWTGNVTGVLLESSQPLTANLNDLGNVSVSFNASMNGYNPSLMISTAIYNQPSTQASTAFTLAATNADLQITSTAYAVYFTKENLGENDTISNAVLRMTASPAWVDANGGPTAIRVFRQDDNGDISILTPTYLGRDSDGMMVFEVISPDGFSSFAVAATKTTVIPTPPSGGGGGGGSSGSTTSIYTGSGTLLTSSAGTVLKSVIVNANDNIGNLLIPIGTTALDADGKPLGDASIVPIAGDAIPSVPSGSVFEFAGYAYEAGPDGATFDPAITLSFDIPEDVWNTLDLSKNDLTIKWYNKETGLWEDIQTTVIPGTRTVEARITHFSTFALFTEPITTPVTPTETATTTTTITTPPSEPPAEGLPMMMILAIFAVVVIIAAAGYFLMMRK